MKESGAAGGGFHRKGAENAGAHETEALAAGQDLEVRKKGGMRHGRLKFLKLLAEFGMFIGRHALLLSVFCDCPVILPRGLDIRVPRKCQH